tara:strand:- start:28005 stop:28250 length:246 start_codon:yes stop_codon:yes gene_type:complete
MQIQFNIFVVITIFGHSKLPWPDQFATLFALPGYSPEKSQFGQQKSMAIMAKLLHFIEFGASAEKLPADPMEIDQPRSTSC